jgi:hypothetical protein
MEEEIQKRQYFLDTRYFNGKKGGRPIKPNNKPNGKPNRKPKHNLPENENENINNNRVDNKKEEFEGKTKIDYDFVVENYHFLCPKMNKVQVINDQRKGFINARVGEYGMEKVISVIRMAGESDFLNGKNGNAWKADFEWILRPQNFVKIMEGKYKSEKNKSVMP